MLSLRVKLLNRAAYSVAAYGRHDGRAPFVNKISLAGGAFAGRNIVANAKYPQKKGEYKGDSEKAPFRRSV